MIIMCDIDNTINNLQEATTNLFNEHYGTHYALSNFNDYDVANVLPVKEAIAMKELYGESGIYNYVRPMHDAQEAIQKLLNNGHQVYFVTDAISKNYYEKVEWVKHFFPFIDEAHIVAMKHKHLFKCDVMIEDNMKNLLAGVSYHRICYDRPWNRAVHDYVYDIHRCKDWKEIIKAVDEIEREIEKWMKE